MNFSNPNFPKNLDIHPSKPQSSSIDLGDAFGSLAQEEAIRQYGIAGRVWEAAYLITSYLQNIHHQFDPPLISSTSSGDLLMIELGSGSGLVASTFTKVLSLDSRKFCFIATDLPEVCPLLESNLQRNQRKTDLRVRPLSWGNKEHVDAIFSEILKSTPDRRLTHIICSDLVYFPELLAPLLRSLLYLTSHPFVTSRKSAEAQTSPVVYISYKVRSLAKETAFWSAFGLWFEFYPVLFRGNTKDAVWERFGSHLDDTSFLFYARRRVESYDWPIPEIDKDLLDGVGANGTHTRKSDDTFENLLLMSL
ncbi:hypothetical protein CVT24_002168 [Panaeolus cyanescens]|uniref:Uncharacterized protein n=1 Tax=Panaeolus cyanescens TaxID=181874 RepID=A0A409YHU8_9AGAR|nr:hypothetical protein CVT24_002168 [Panaeolus cyanescens]